MNERGEVQRAKAGGEDGGGKKEKESNGSRKGLLEMGRRWGNGLKRHWEGGAEVKGNEEGVNTFDGEHLIKRSSGGG